VGRKMYLVLIAIHKGGKHNKDILGFRILDSDSGEVQDIPYNNVVNAIKTKNVTVDGIDISTGEPKGSNGSFDRYTQLVDGITIGKCPVVIIKEYPDKIYDVANHLGAIAHMDMESIIKFSETEGIANGRIVETENNKYISSISGEYQKDRSFKDRASGEKLKLKMNMIGLDSVKLSDRNYLVGLNKETEHIAIGKGCLGIEPYGLKDFTKLKEITLPSTCTDLGIGAFLNCVELENIEIPEGVAVIPKQCFAGCKKLTKIVLPNSIRKVEAGAFRNSGLKEVSLGPVKPELTSMSFTPSTRVTVRR
jgi:hypothetical protein